MKLKNKLNEASQYDHLIYNIKENVNDLEEHADDIEEHAVQYAIDILYNTLTLIRRMEDSDSSLKSLYKQDFKWIIDTARKL